MHLKIDRLILHMQGFDKRKHTLAGLFASEE